MLVLIFRKKGFSWLKRRGLYFWIRLINWLCLKVIIVGI